MGFSGFSQGIVVNTSNTPDQLVNQVLINSPCVSGSNVTASTGSDFGSTNGIGSFVNYNQNFPFATGIVLTTGDVAQTPSPNNSILSAGTAGWGGDADLESILLSQSGVTINSVNASYLQFDFTPTSANFDFNFIFASEEYGASQCNYSDAFAFILTDITAGGAPVNLALVPGPGNVPISVATIRDDANNPNCPSANPAFFGAYNGPGFGPAINFNGQTVQMTASATGLDITHTYRIKIVIADGGDNTEYDSAIFIEGSSFNIGQNVLGPDKTAANGTATCMGSTLPILEPQTPLEAGTTYQWLDAAGDPIPGETNPFLDLNTVTPAPVAGINSYSLVYTQPSCTAITDDIKVELFPAVQALATVPDRYLCTAPYTFDLGLTSTVILTNNTTVPGDDLPAGTLISYHDTQAQAELGTPDLPLNYTITQAQSPKTVWTRIENPATGCFAIRSFVLHAVNPPAALPNPLIPEMIACARNATDSPPRAVFDFTAAINAALGAQSPADYHVTFYSTLAAANDPASTAAYVLTPSNQVTSTTRTVYVRVQVGNNPDCMVVGQFQVTVTPLPQVDVLQDVVVCTSYTLPALTYAGSVYRTADNGGGTVLPVGSAVTPTTVTTVYVYNPGDGTCPAGKDSFTVRKADFAVSGPPQTQAPVCQTVGYPLPALPYGSYHPLPNGGGPAIAPYTITNPGTTTLYAYFENPDEAGCVIDYPFTVEVVPFTNIPDQADAFACTSYTLPAPPPGTSYFSQPMGGGTPIAAGTVYNTAGVYQVYLYKESATTPTNCEDDELITITIGIGNLTAPSPVTACQGYVLPALSVGQYRTAAAGGGSVIPAGTNITTTQTVYYYVPGESCTDNLSFLVTIQQTPLPAFAPQNVCNVYYLPAVAHTGNYYTGAGGTGTLLPVDYPVTSTQTIYFYDALPGNPACFVEASFLVTVEPEPQLDVVPQPQPICNGTYTIPALTNGAFYYNAGGPSGSNPAIPAGTVITTTGGAPLTLYLYNGNTSGICPPAEYTIEIEIVNTEVTLPDSLADGDTIERCDDTGYPLPALALGNYYLQPVDPANSSDPANPPIPLPHTVTASMPIYVYAEDNNRIPCSDQKMFNVSILARPDVAPLTTEEACGSFTLPALPAGATGYFEQSGGPTNPTNVQRAPGYTINASTTIYVYADSPGADPALCPDEEPWQINVTPAPVFTPAPEDTNGDFIIDHCDPYTLPAPAAFTPTATGYVTTNDGSDVPLASTTLTAATTTFYIRAESAAPASCPTYQEMTVNIFNTPVLAAPAGAPYSVCDTFTFPALPAGATAFYSEPGGPATPGNQVFMPGDTFAVIGIHDFYPYAASGPASNPNQCPAADVPFSVTVSQTPVIPDYPAVVRCEPWPVSSIALPAGAALYTDPGHTTPFNASQVTTSMTLYVYAESPTNPACNDSDDFTVTINAGPTANPVTPIETTVCDEDGDGLYDFDLDALTPTILGGQNPADFTVAYYETAQEAALGVNAIPTDGTPDGDTGGTIANIYAVVTNVAAPDCVSSPLHIPLIIVPKPVEESIQVVDPVCVNSETGEITPAYVISGYSSQYYAFTWEDADGNVVSTQPNFTTTTSGTYNLTITATINGLTGCEAGPFAVEIIESGKPQNVEVNVTTGYFTDSQTIEVIATPISGTVGTFVYSLDGMEPQASNIFEGVSEGWHEVIVIDPNGCGDAAVPVQVQTVYNPKYFTPNGDGINDTYRIPALASQPGSVITIYDRHGKLLKSYTADSDGWDGTFNGNPLPADDYWFTVIYVEGGEAKEYKSHFSLVR